MRIWTVIRYYCTYFGRRTGLTVRRVVSSYCFYSSRLLVHSLDCETRGVPRLLRLQHFFCSERSEHSYCCLSVDRMNFVPVFFRFQYFFRPVTVSYFWWHSPANCSNLGYLVRIQYSTLHIANKDKYHKYIHAVFYQFEWFYLFIGKFGGMGGSIIISKLLHIDILRRPFLTELASSWKMAKCENAKEIQYNKILPLIF